MREGCWLASLPPGRERLLGLIDIVPGNAVCIQGCQRQGAALRHDVYLPVGGCCASAGGYQERIFPQFRLKNAHGLQFPFLASVPELRGDLQRVKRGKCVAANGKQKNRGQSSAGGQEQLLPVRSFGPASVHQPVQPHLHWQDFRRRIAESHRDLLEKSPVCDRRDLLDHHGQRAGRDFVAIKTERIAGQERKCEGGNCEPARAVPAGQPAGIRECRRAALRTRGQPGETRSF